MKFDFTSGEWSERDTNPNKIAVVGTDRTLTWAQLSQEVDALAEVLKKTRKSQSPVMIYGHKEAGMVSSILACLKARVPYVPVDTIVPAARVQSVITIADIEMVLRVSGEPVEGILNLEIPTFESKGTVRKTDGEWRGAKDLAYIIFTSGSTGEPKGVQIQRPNVSDLASWVASNDFGFTADDVILSQCSFSFDVSFFDVIATMQSGASIVLSSPQELKKPKPFQDVLSSLVPTVWSSTPSFLSLSLTAPGFDHEAFSKLRRFYLAGEAVHGNLAQRLWRRFPKGELWNAYGPTEATVICTLVHVTPEILEKYGTVPIGRVKPGNVMPTTASDGVSEGELWIIGDNISPGYLNRPDLNQTRFAMKDGKRGYLTGDVGYHKDGFVFCQGRIDSQIKLHGYRIELEEIDNHVGSVPGVEGAVTVALRRDGDVKKLICFIKKKDGAPENLIDQVKEQIAKTLPYYMVPADFRLTPEFPYNTNHKVDRLALAKTLT